MVPAADVAPEWEYPTPGATLKTIAAPLRDDIEVCMTTEITRSNDRYASEQGMEAVAGEVYDPEMEASVREMLLQLGEDPTREGLVRTPLRVAKAMAAGAITTRVELLDAAAKREEIARMLAGAKVTDEARAAADRLIGAPVTALPKRRRAT